MAKTALIIDDAEEMRLLLSRILELKGFSVVLAEDGPTGTSLASELLPDLITMDFNMPGQNGVETYSQLRAKPETAVIPVIFISATMTGLIKRMVIDNPRIRFLKKPCKRDVFEQCVDEMLALPKLAPPPAPPKKDPNGFEPCE